MPWMNFLEKEPPGFCSRNEHHPLYNQRSTKTAPHSQLPLFSSPHPLCHGPRTAQDPENVRGVHKQTHTHHFMALIPTKHWEVSLVAKPVWLLLISSELHSLRLQRLCTWQTRSLCLSKWQHAIWSGVWPCVRKPHPLSSVPPGQKVCVDATKEVPASVDGHCTGCSRHKSWATFHCALISGEAGGQNCASHQTST